eukprot:gene7663-1279_t
MPVQRRRNGIVRWPRDGLVPVPSPQTGMGRHFQGRLGSPD